MDKSTENFREEIKKMYRKADMLCTAHSVERAIYQRKATIVDILLMITSAYIVLMAFVDPSFVPKLIPNQWDLVLWIGFLSVTTFILSMLQFIVNWKGLADAHDRSFGMYAETKSKCIKLLNGNCQISREEYNGIRTHYDMASTIGINIEDSRFLKLKQRHLIKMEISRILDHRPSAWVWCLKVSLWWRDTFKSDIEKQKNDQNQE